MAGIIADQAGPGVWRAWGRACADPKPDRLMSKCCLATLLIPPRGGGGKAALGALMSKCCLATLLIPPRGGGGKAALGALLALQQVDQRLACAVAVDIEVSVYRQHMLELQAGGGFGDGCVGQVERQAGEALADAQHVSQ